MWLLAFNAAIFLAGAWALTQFPFELDYGEGIVLWQTKHVMTLTAAYHPITEYPYTVFHYPPLFHLLARFVGVLAGDPLVAGRLVAFFSAVGAAALVGLIVKLGAPCRSDRRIVPALVASLLVFHLPNIDWVPNMRVDMTALCLSFLALYLFLRLPGVWGAALAGLVFAASLFTKQSMIAGPAAVLLGALLTGRRRDAMAMLVVMAVLGAGTLGFLTVATDGEFLRHTVTYNANPFDVGQLIGFTLGNLQGMNALAGLALALPLTLVSTRRSSRAVTHCNGAARRRAVVLTAVLYLAAASVTCLTAGKLGAWKNYFLEWNFACCILIGLLLQQILERRRRLSRSATAMAVILILGVVGFSGVGTTIRQWRLVLGHEDRLNQSAADASRALAIMQATPGRVFSDDMTLLMKARRDIPWEPAIVTVLAATGAWNEAPILDMISSRQFQTIIVRYLDNPLFFSPGVRAAIHHAYVDSGTPAGHYQVLVPRRPDPPAAARPELPATRPDDRRRP